VARWGRVRHAIEWREERGEWRGERGKKRGEKGTRGKKLEIRGVVDQLAAPPSP